MYTASRRTQLVPNIVFVDGLSGSGKTALFKVLSSFDRVETVRFEPMCDYICALTFLNRMEPDVASSLLRLQLDRVFYNAMISREVNFRPNDASSVLSSPNRTLYMERLFLPDGQRVGPRIEKERPILHIMTHQALGISKPIFQAFEDYFVLLEMVRQPLLLIPAWFSYIDRYGTDPFELSVCFDYKGKDLPWFAMGWEKNYLKSNKMDRIIRSIEIISNLKRQYLSSLTKEYTKRVLQIPFEKFVIDPCPYIELIEKMLSTKHMPETEMVLKEQNIPRKITMDVPDNEAFQKYGYIPLEKETTENAEIEKQWDFVKQNASPEGLGILKALNAEYRKEYLSNAKINTAK